MTHHRYALGAFVCAFVSYSAGAKGGEVDNRFRDGRIKLAVETPLYVSIMIKKKKRKEKKRKKKKER